MTGFFHLAKVHRVLACVGNLFVFIAKYSTVWIHNNLLLADISLFPFVGYYE